MGRHGFSFDATRGGEPRREKEKSLGGEVKKKRIKRKGGIRKGGKERWWWCVCCFQSTIKRAGQVVAED
jgi:23S rRNA A1618 N6-methylase RlmF